MPIRGVSKPETLTPTVSAKEQVQARSKERWPRPQRPRDEQRHSSIKIADQVEVNIDPTESVSGLHSLTNNSHPREPTVREPTGHHPAPNKQEPERRPASQQSEYECTYLLKAPCISAEETDVATFRNSILICPLMILVLRIDAQIRPEWTTPLAPFRIADNLYYMWVCCDLLRTW